MVKIVALGLVVVLGLAPLAARAAGPTIAFTLPAENTTPATFGSLPFPNDLYFDQGEPGDGDGTLLNAGASIGLGVDVVPINTGSFEDAFDVLDGFGTSSAVYFFLDGPIDGLPASPILVPSLADPVFCADAATATPVPIDLKFDIDTRIPNVLAVLPVPGRPLAPSTTYVCVVRRSLTGGGDPVEPAADWVTVRDGTSANTDADAIHDPVVTTLVGAGVPAADIAGMTVFTTQSTTIDLIKIRQDVLPLLSVPTADFTSQPGLVFDSPAELLALLGSAPAALGVVATGYYGSPNFQSLDPDGTGPLQDFPVPPAFVTCVANNCETNDERFTRDGSGTPIVISTPQIPFTVTVPAGSPPPDGWPVIIQQHGLGGQRDTIMAFAEIDAAAGFASIGIDAVAHGYRFFDCSPAAACSQDTANNFGGTAVPDGFVDGTFFGFDTGFLTVNLGLFEAFHNFIGIRDNFRQTYVDLMSLVRLIKGGSIDSGLGVNLDENRIFYMGHSLGGLMGSGFVPQEPDLAAAVLNATGGGLSSQLFINSSIGAGAQALVNGILGLDPANTVDQFAFQANLTQMILDPGDGVNSAGLLLAPALGTARNVIQISDLGDQVVPNQANEVLAVAAGLEIFDPFVVNLARNPLSLAVANFATPKTVSGNAAGGTATAIFLQNGPATHAASIGDTPGTLTFVPDFALIDELPISGNAFPELERGIRVPNLGILPDLLDWFSDIVTNGPPGTFSLAADENFNPVQNAQVPAGASLNTFFARTVDAGGALAASEPTPDVVVDFSANAVATRLTVARSILGATPLANDNDVPPGPDVSVGTPGILPFFVTLQRLVPALFTADLTVGYTTDELLAAGITPGSGDEGGLLLATFAPGTCTIGGAVCDENADCGINGPCVGAGYTPLLGTVVDVGAHTAMASGLTDFSTFALLTSNDLTVLEPGAGKKRTDCRAEWRVINPNAPPPGLRSRSRARQSCQDGDASCDASGAGADGRCVFRVAICFDPADPSLPDCDAGIPVAGYQLRKPLPSNRKPLDAANGQQLLDVLLAVGGTLGGKKNNEVTFTAPQTTGACTPLASIEVPVGKSGTLRGRARATTGRRDDDSDRLRLQCLH